MDDEQQRDLARRLRAELDLVIINEADRRAAAAELDAALARSGIEGDRRLADVLGARAETRAWMRERDPDGDPDRIVEQAGDVTDVGTYFVCPHEDFDFIRTSVADVVPVCPVHKVPLVAAEE